MKHIVRPGSASLVPHQHVRCRAHAHVPLRCRAQQTTYQAPSYRTAATELDVLERFSVVVPDTGALKEIQQIDDPKAATVSSAVLSGILRNPAGQQELKASEIFCSGLVTHWRTLLPAMPANASLAILKKLECAAGSN